MRVTDTFALIVAMLAGAPVPPLPAIRGRIFRAPPVTDDDPHAEAWERAAAGESADSTDEGAT